ncbi:MAG: zinc ABC transporter substrate-binding protein [Burkholderiaceae bacterium]|nr:zinc ABC transporter substrate-binding protein [Burkholderiaceae bacterium]
MRPIRRRAFCQGSAALTTLFPLAIGAQPPAPRVVASFSILADMAQELVPAGVQVTALVGPDSDAHVYEPSPADGKRLAQADLVLVNGLGFEGWIERMVKVSGYRGPVAVASQGIQPRSGGHHDGDPHAWQDLALARRYSANISAAIAQRWPGQRDEIARRNADYVARIDLLDVRVRQWLGAVPRAQRRVITSHDAFGYFGVAYGVDFLAPQGWNTHSEPSAAAVARLIRQIRKDEARAIFVENISDPRLVERIAREGGARVGGTLYSDALSKPGGPAATYLQMFEHNARSLAAALQV